MVSRNSVLLIVVGLALAVQPVTAAVAAPTAVSTPTADASTVTTPVADANGTAAAQSHPADPDADVLGWEAGYWYNESIAVTPEDGLNDSELDAVVARGMARVEQIRRIEFEQTPPVEVIGREALETRVRNNSANTTETQRLKENIKYEALLMVNESTDAVEVNADNQGGGIGGFYDPATGEIKIVSENTETPKMDEITLSQELFHALQDQRFNISSFNQSTQELHNAKDGIIEGDGNYLDHLYQQRCENEWAGTCLMPDEPGAPADFAPHFGLYQIQLQPYSDGPPFVKAIREEGGWDAVNAIYEHPPASTEQTIHPETYGEDEPTNVSVPDRSDDRWRPLDVNNSLNYASFGEAGLFVTLWYPAMESKGAVSVIPLRDHFNLAAGGVQQFNPYSYDHKFTAGWDGDKLVPYVTDESTETNETGYVYRTVWDSPAEAAEFQDGYERLLEVNGAEAVEGHAGTYRIPDGNEFGDAFYVNQSGDRFTIVNAPSVEALSAVQQGAAPAETSPGESEDTPTDTGDTTTENADATTAGPDRTTDYAGGGAVTDSTTSDTTPSGATTADGPGFTLGAAMVAFIGFAVFATRRR